MFLWVWGWSWCLYEAEDDLCLVMRWSWSQCSCWCFSEIKADLGAWCFYNVDWSLRFSEFQVDLGVSLSWSCSWDFSDVSLVVPVRLRLILVHLWVQSLCFCEVNLESFDLVVISPILYMQITSSCYPLQLLRCFIMYQRHDTVYCNE